MAIGKDATVQDEYFVSIGSGANNTPVYEGANKDELQTAKSAVALGHNA